VAVRLSSRNVFLPDLSYFTAEQVARLEATHAPFAPALVVEALSPTTAARTADRAVGPKFAAYEEHGVEEYWILDSRSRDARPPLLPPRGGPPGRIRARGACDPQPRPSRVLCPARLARSRLSSGGRRSPRGIGFERISLGRPRVADRRLIGAPPRENLLAGARGDCLAGNP
jgi:hypothetical protein